MKGCLAVVGGIVVLIVIAMLAFGGYLGFKGYKAMEQFSTDMSRVEETSNVSFPFTAPPVSKLDPTRTALAFAIREKVSASLAEAAAGAEAAAKDKNLKGAFDMMTEFGDAFVGLPGRLEVELQTGKMSLAEYFWIVNTAHGSVFAAADQGDPSAKELESKLIATMKAPGMEFGPGGKKQAESFDDFRARMKASLIQFDGSSLGVIRGCGERYPGNRAEIMVDGITLEYQRLKRLNTK